MNAIGTILIFLLSSFLHNVYGQISTADREQATLSGEKKKFRLFGRLGLSQNYPNPVLASESTVIRYRVDGALDAAIIFYDKSNRKKAVLVFDNLDRNSQYIEVRGNQLPAGKYIYALFVYGRMVEKKVMVVVNQIK